MDFFDEYEIDDSLTVIEQLLSSGIFNSQNARSIFFKPAFISVLISLRDLMYKSEKYSSRIAFADDVIQVGKVNDVSDLIKFVRDALCHPDSDNHYVEDGIKSSFNVFFGGGSIAQVGGQRQENSYDDDICFYFGPHRIYLRRHIIRAFEEADAKLSPLMNGGQGRMKRS
jgi:hypothetical protein